MAKLVKVYRVKKISKLTPLRDRFKVDGEKFKIIGELGSSTSTAYLAKGKNGKKVVLKDYSDEVKQNSRAIVLYEARITEYLLKKGANVPDVVAFESDKGLIVKEYEEGLTSTEFQGARELGLKRKDEDRILKDLDQERARVSRLMKYREFLNWLSVEYPQDYEIIQNVPQILRDFIKTAIDGNNFLYSFKKRRWLYIDP